MRIISGKYKGRRLQAPKNLPVRPTTDMAKEALFNILNNHFNFGELKILDLFSGTGNIAYEFASRGATPLVAVDADMGCVNFIRKISNEFDFDITPIKSDVFTFLQKHKGSYDIIFADPPYQDTQFSTVTRLFAHLKPGALMVLSHPGRGEAPTGTKGIVVVDNRSYGTANLTFFRKVE